MKTIRIAEKSSEPIFVQSFSGRDEVDDAQRVAARGGRHLLVGTSYGGGAIPEAQVVRASDGATPKPIAFNEDDHFDFDKAENNFTAAVAAGASWGFLDFRMAGEGPEEGYQSVPVNWGISSERKRAFFQLLAEMTGGR